ncbi:MAG: hypothetical protein RLT30_00345, partial [Gammaproteobacteria bacterium]
MKNKKLSKTGFIATALALSLLAAPAMADETDEKRAKWREHVQKFDRDGDGQLNNAERQALKESRRAKMLEKFDTDGDGQLNNAERQVLKESRRAKMLEKFDIDGDGQLNDREKQAARTA